MWKEIKDGECFISYHYIKEKKQTQSANKLQITLKEWIQSASSIFFLRNITDLQRVLPWTMKEAGSAYHQK